MLWENQNIVFSDENRISMFVMSFTLRSNSFLYFGCKYIEQFSKINQKNTEVFANVPSLRLYRIVFGEVRNSFIGNILVYSREKTREKEKQGFRKKNKLQFTNTHCFYQWVHCSQVFMWLFSSIFASCSPGTKLSAFYICKRTLAVSGTRFFASKFNDKVARYWW